MSNTNNVNIVIPPAEIEEVLNCIKKIDDILDPYMIALTPDDRRTLAKMGDKTLAFVTKARDYAQNSPEFAPKYLNVADFDIDATAAQVLTSILQKLVPLVNELDDTTMLSGSEANIHALMYYNSVREAADRNVPGAKGIYDDLKERFQKTKKTPAIPQV